MSDRPPPGAVLEQEWLVANGTGSYASGTIAGVLTRRYHGLLVAALDPPVGRTVLVAKVDDTFAIDDEPHSLSTDRWQDPAGPLGGLPHLQGFRLDGSVPVWSFVVGETRLEKRVWMRHGHDTTYLRYTNAAGDAPTEVVAKVLVNYRDHHATTRSDDWRMDVEPVPSGVEITAFEGAVPFRILSTEAAITPQHTWYRDYALRMEADRGLEALDDHLYAATFTVTLEPGTSATLAVTTETSPDLDGNRRLAARVERDRHVITAGGAGDDIAARLALAADQFIVRRPPGDGRSIIAGYHWFGDWGRDTMVALPGLALATGRPDEAEAILRTYAQHVDRGMLPNRFPDIGSGPEYNTFDAALWYVEAIRAYHEATGDRQLIGDVFPVIADIVDWYEAGTRYDIHVDPADGLLTGGVEGTQLTWMDARIGEWVVTPRIGKPIEVNALWYNALCATADLARQVGERPDRFAAAAERARIGLARFWNEDRGFCFDVLDGPDGPEPALRPNQLLAVSLPHSALEPERQRAIVTICRRELLTPLGLRTLGPAEPGYRGRYGGGPAERDGAYHQGTVWPWLVGPYAAAHLRVYRDLAAVRRLLEPFLAHFGEYGIGSITECADGDPPHHPRAAIAQAWSVAEVLRIWRLVAEPAPAHSS